MKNVRIILGTLVLAAFMAGTATETSAKNSNRDENGKIIRHPYLTNGLWSNWFVGAAGGVNVFFDGAYNPAIAPALDITVGKWVTPSVGARVGYQGLYGSEWSRKPSVLGSELNTEKNRYQQKFGFAYIHGDIMWNFTNAVFGYKDKRFWSIIPYVHAGLLRVYNRAGAPQFIDNEFAAGAGVLQNFRLCDRLDLTLDVRGFFASGRYHANVGGPAGEISATLGLAVDLGKNKWLRASEYHNPADMDKISAAEAAAAALTAANAALAVDNADLQKGNAALEAENAKLQKALADAAANTGLNEAGPAAFYFEIGKTELSAKELKHLDYYMNNVLKNVKGGKATVITGTADSNTGYAKRNEYLSKARAEYVADLLKTKYGVEVDNVKNAVVKAAKGQAAFDRACVISVE
ncbi:MAG: hypothetical protein E7124_03215 [Bacteroidales bacterium]|nr:hypothetical protein [Bacteroidales bacterium]